MGTVFEIPRGTRDFIPQDMIKRRFVEEKFRAIFESFGYKEIQTPTFEHLDLFTMKSGQAVIDELYVFIDKGGRNLALRPELTAPVIRCYVEKLQMEPKPLKLYYLGNCFRYDRPQKGRYREFMQAGCELIGPSSPEGFAELICLAFLLVKDVGVKDIVLECGHIGLLRKVLSALSLNDEQTKRILPFIDKEQFDELSTLLSEYAIPSEQKSLFMDIIKHGRLDMLKDLFKDSKEETLQIERLEEMIHILNDLIGKDSFTLNMGIVRGLDYYTGVVFEIKAPSLGAEKQICGGGEYDLISLFGGRNTPTSGFALGFDRTLLAMEIENAVFPSIDIDYFIIPVSKDEISSALRIALHLRKNGKIVDVDLMRRGIGKALKYAGSLHASHAIIIGSRELSDQVVSVRDMNTGEQQDVPLKTLIPDFML